MKLAFPKLKLPLLLAGVLLLVGRLAQGAQFLDWYQARDAAYQTLKRAALANNQDGWVVERMKNSQPVPQASARDLAQELENSDEVSQQDKDALKKAFPSEMVLTKIQPPPAEQAAQIQERINSLNLMIEDFEQRKLRNVYGPDTALQIRATTGLGFGVTGGEGLGGPDALGGGNVDPISFIGPTSLLEMTGNFGNVTFYNLFSLSNVSGNGGGGRFVNQNYNTLEGFPGTQASYTFNNDWLWNDSWKVTLDFSPDWFQNLQFTAGKYIATRLDGLTYSGLTGATGAPASAYLENPFFRQRGLTSEALNIPEGSRESNGFYLQKAGSTGWWIFDQSEFIFIPQFANYATLTSDIARPEDRPYEMQEPFNYTAGRVDLIHRDLFPLVDANIWSSYFIAWPQTGLANVTQPLGYNEQDHDYSVGVNTKVLGNGRLIGEAAFSNFDSQGPQPSTYIKKSLDWSDQAYTLDLSKPLGTLTMDLSGDQLGSKYVVGPRRGLWTDNSQMADFLDSSVDDPRPGNIGQVAYQTIVEDSSFKINNTQGLKVQAGWSSAWGSAGVSGGFRQQLLASGPWVQTERTLNNNWIAGQGWQNLFGNDSSPVYPSSAPPPANVNNNTYLYNSPTYAKSYYNGQTVTAGYNNVYNRYGKTAPPTLTGSNWDDLQQLGQPAVSETILLSQNGNGDFNLRKDSVKVTNHLRAEAQLDLQTIFNMAWPCGLQGYTELRDLDESIHLAGWRPQDLLEQEVTELFFTYQVNKIFTWQNYLASEFWLSNASAFPVSSEDREWGTGFDVDLSAYLSSLVLTSRYTDFNHHDDNYSVRNVHGWMFSISIALGY